jgi:hypothetical protein
MTKSRRKASTPAKRKTKVAAKRYELTPREREAHKAITARLRKKLPSPRLKVTEKSGVESFIEPDHPDLETGLALLTEAFGTHNMAFTGGLIGQIASTASKGQELNEKDLNFMLSMVKGVEPRDQIEAMLAAQMAAVHNATMTYAQRLKVADTIMQSDAAERTFNKLARTFTTQMAALKNYRTGGQQKMTVEHVHVHEGGQAIVGNVQGGGGIARKGEPTP